MAVLAALSAGHEMTRKMRPLRVLETNTSHYFVNRGAEESIMRGEAVEKMFLLGLRQRGTRREVHDITHSSSLNLVKNSSVP